MQRLFGRPLPDGASIGESWEVSDRPGAQSRVADGPHAGKTLQDLGQMFGEALAGSLAGATSPGRFPLLIKWIDAGEPLSVQVHPDDEGARALGESDPGKTEAWVIADASPEARMVYGLRERMDAEAVITASASGQIERHLRWVSPQAGDCFMVPPGTVHALGANTVVYEVQQNSDLTYRLYDWGRTGPDGRPRDLHLSQAAAVLNSAFDLRGPVPPVVLPIEGGARRYAVACPYFALEVLEIRAGGAVADRCDGRSFHALTVWTGKGEIVWEGTRHQATGKSKQQDSMPHASRLTPALSPHASRLSLLPGETVLVPACAGDYRLISPGGMKVIKAYVPDLFKDIEAPLRAAGVGATAIQRLMALAGEGP